jgi:hypothetical protein
MSMCIKLLNIKRVFERNNGKWCGVLGCIVLCDGVVSYGIVVWYGIVSYCIVVWMVDATH